MRFASPWRSFQPARRVSRGGPARRPAGDAANGRRPGDPKSGWVPPSTRGLFAAASPAGRRALAAALGIGLALGAVAEGVRGQGNPLPLGEHRDLVVGACVICHSLETMAQQRLDRETWETIVDRMITYGAPITPETRPRILEYLAKHLGP